MRQPLHRRRLLASLATLSATGLAGLAGLVSGCASTIKDAGGAEDKSGGAANRSTESATALPQQRYTETVSSLLISKDNKNIVFIGRSFHYVFEAPPQLVQCLMSSLHARIKGDISGLHVDPTGAVTGSYRLFLQGPSSPDETTLAQALGFRPTAPGMAGTVAAAATYSEPRLELAGELKGQRYVRSALREGRQLEALNQRYTVEITAEQSRADAVADQLATPLTMGSDGVLLLYYIVLAPLLLPLAILSREPRR